MAIPVEFNDTEHAQAVVRRYINKKIVQDFQDLNDANGNWEPDVTTTRGAMRHALIHKDNDPLSLTLLRCFLYYFIYGKAKALQASIVGLEKQNFDELHEVSYRPIVTLFFRQDLSAVPNGFTALSAEISFRLMNETTQSLSNANIQTLATKIRSELAVSGGYTFNKGKYICRYLDKENGYDFRVRALTDVEGKNVIKKILGIRGHVFDDNKYSCSTPGRNSDNTPATINILGKAQKKPRWRPTSTVRFLYADLLIYGKPEPVALVDRSGLRPKAIELVYN